jgi:ABC-type dipeptide transport system, periplasmic component
VPADAQVLPDIPRGDVLIVDALHGRLAVIDFNAWKPGVNLGNGIYQMLMDMWYVEPTSGEWINALAAKKPIYNEDATQMTLNLRKGIYWSDGVELTADDVVYTVKIQMETSGLIYTTSSTLMLKMFMPKTDTQSFLS